MAWAASSWMPCDRSAQVIDLLVREVDLERTDRRSGLDGGAHANLPRWYDPAPRPYALPTGMGKTGNQIVTDGQRGSERDGRSKAPMLATSSITVRLCPPPGFRYNPHLPGLTIAAPS